MDKLKKKVGRFEATILFCDIRGFTSLFDRRDPEEALFFANAVLGELGAIVEACQGTVDKFTGDGFLAHFGISTELANHAEEACWCAIRMRSSLTLINSARYFDQQPVVAVGIGIHTGIVAAGTIASMHKSEHTILGSAVNLTARIEGLTKYFGVDCLLSDETARRVSDRFLLQKMPAKSVHGVSELVHANWLLPLNTWP